MLKGRKHFLQDCFRIWDVEEAAVVVAVVAVVDGVEEVLLLLMLECRLGMSAVYLQREHLMIKDRENSSRSSMPWSSSWGKERAIPLSVGVVDGFASVGGGGCGMLAMFSSSVVSSSGS